MNNEMTIRQERMNPVMNFVAATRQPLVKLSQYYSNVLGRNVNIRQTLHLLNAQAAFLMTVFPDTTAPVKALCLSWFVASILKCREKHL